MSTPEKMDERILLKLFEVLKERKLADPETSYTARLYAKGINKIAQKLGEEAVETAIAAVSESNDRLVRESADLLYHLVVLWVSAGIDPKEVWAEMARREQLFGIAEKLPKESPKAPSKDLGDASRRKVVALETRRPKRH